MIKTQSIFADYASRYRELDLRVIPCGGNSGKEPLVKWRHFINKQQGNRSVDKFIEQFPDANIAILCGEPSGITVIDDDFGYNTEGIFAEFGRTPLTVTTASGKKHYYYRYNSEASRHITENKLEIKSTGNIIVAPPSYIAKHNNCYKLDWNGFEPGFQEDLPTIKPEALLKYTRHIPEGERNTALFDYLRSEALSIGTKEALLETALRFNHEQISAPLSDREVEQTVESVWRYKQSGNLVPPGSQYAMVTPEEVLTLPGNVLKLLACLKYNHNGLRSEFVICAPAMSQSLGLSKATIERARNKLLENGIILQTHKGGSGPGDPNKYRFL